MEGGRPVVKRNSKGNLLTKSVVHIDEKGKAIVGDEAARKMVLNPTCTISGIKRLIGRKLSEVIDLVPRLSYHVVPGSAGFASVYIREKEYSPEEISAHILREAKAAAEKHLGHEVSRAVVTVPAYFNDLQRMATFRAVEMAGLKVERIINEPTAAALAYGLDKSIDKKIAVFDLGGGTFDVTLLEFGDGVFEVLAINGDGFIGGDDFDEAIVEWLCEECLMLHGSLISNKQEVRQQLLDSASKAKIELSTSTEYLIELPYLELENGSMVHFRALLTQLKFEEVSTELFQKLRVPCQKVLHDAHLIKSEIDEVIMVGGAARMKKIDQLVHEEFGRLPNRTINPDEAVALGAAIQGGVFVGEVKDTLLLDVIAHSIGVETNDGKVIDIVAANTTIPTKRTKVFTTEFIGQKSVEVHVVEGEAKDALACKSLGRVSLEILEGKDISEVSVTINIDENGNIMAMVKDELTGNEAKEMVRSHTIPEPEQ